MTTRGALAEEIAIEAAASETMRLLGKEDRDGAYVYLSQLSKSEIEKTADLIGIVGIFNTKTKVELLERVRSQLWAFTPSGREKIRQRRHQELLRCHINERLKYAIGNRAGYCGGPIDVPLDAPVEEKQAGFRRTIDGYLRDLDDSPESEAIKAKVEEWWNSPITAGVRIREIKAYLAEKEAKAAGLEETA